MWSCVSEIKKKIRIKISEMTGACVSTKNSVAHQTMLHQNLSTAPVGAPKVFKKCQIEQMSRHTQDNRDILTKEGWQHVVTGRAKVYDECLVVLKLCLSHSPMELAHAL